MQLSARGDRLRAALEEVVGAPASVEVVAPARVRISIPFPDSLSVAKFRAAREVTERGDDYGSSGETGALILWAEIHEPTKGQG